MKIRNAAAQSLPRGISRVALGLLAALAAGPSMAQHASTAVFVGDGQGGSVAGTAADMLARAGELGTLPVIVGFRAAFVPEGDLTEPQATAQRGQFAAARQSVLGLVPGAVNVKTFDTIPYVAVTVGPAELGKLLTDPAVASVHEDVAVPPLLADSVPLINADDMWAGGIRGTGKVVAVLDTGVQLLHPAFTGKIVSQACYSTTNANNASTSVCPGGKAAATGAGAGKNCDTAVRGCDHGTHVAGIAVGNPKAPKGVARSSGLIPVQVFSRFANDAQCGAGLAPCALSYQSDQMKGLERVYGLRYKFSIAAVNMSLGGGSNAAACDDSPLKPVIDNLRSARIATVIASGNNGYNGTIGAPACISSAVAVGSTTKGDDVSDFSNHSNLVVLMAPGSSINAPVPNKTFGVKSGTSMATPHVAGAWALLREGFPTASVDVIQRALACTGVEVERDNLPKPRIDVDAAHKFLLQPENKARWDFRTKTNVNIWKHELGIWRWRNGELLSVASGAAQTWYAASSPFCSSDLTVSARVRRVDPDTSTNWNSGLFLFSKIDKNKNMAGMWFAYNKAWGGSAVIWHVAGLNGIDNSCTDCQLLCIDYFADVNIGAMNNIRVDSIGGTHTFYINGEVACAATDTSFKIGSVAMIMAGPASTEGHRYDVDWVSVAKPKVASTLVGGNPATKPLAVPPGITPFGIDDTSTAFR